MGEWSPRDGADLRLHAAGPDAVWARAAELPRDLGYILTPFS